MECAVAGLAEAEVCAWEVVSPVVMVLGVRVSASFAGAFGEDAAGLEDVGVGAAVQLNALGVCRGRSVCAHPGGVAGTAVRLSGSVSGVSADAGRVRVPHGTPQ